MANFLEKLGIIESKEISKPKEKTETPGLTPNPTVVHTMDSSKYKNLFDKVLTDANIPGPDFFEFYKTLESLAPQPIADQQKYILAFTGFQVMGLKKEKMIETANHYLSILKEERKNFDAHSAEVNRMEVIEPRNEIQKISEENMELQKKIQENINRISMLTTQSAESENKLRSAEASFNLELSNTEAKIQGIVNNINSYL